jgi:hypothetical protein
MLGSLSKIAEKLGWSKPETDGVEKFGKAVEHFSQKVEQALDDLTDALLFGRAGKKGQGGVEGDDPLGTGKGLANPEDKPGLIEKLSRYGWMSRGLTAAAAATRVLAVPGAMVGAGLAAGELRDSALEEQVKKGRAKKEDVEEWDEADYGLDPVFGKGKYFSDLSKKRPGEKPPEEKKEEPHARPKRGSELFEERKKKREAAATDKVEYKAEKIRFEATTITFKTKPSPGSQKAPESPAGPGSGPPPSFPGPSGAPPASTGSSGSGGGSSTPERPAGTPGGSAPSFPGPGRPMPSTPAPGPASYGTSRPTQSQSQDSTQGSVNPPPEVLAKARALLENGGNRGELQNFMNRAGYPMSGNWCGQFAASVVKESGGTPPQGAAIASNWVNYGVPVAPGDVRPGDVAVRIRSRYGGTIQPGSIGGHVGFVSSVNQGTGQFGLLAGNQRGVPVVQHGLGEYVYRRAAPVATTPAAPPAAVQSQQTQPTVQSPQVKGFDIDQPPAPPRQPQTITNTVTRNLFGPTPTGRAPASDDTGSSGPSYTDYMGVNN